MDTLNAGMIAAQWRQLDALDLSAAMITSGEAAGIMDMERSHFLRMSRDASHPLAEFLRPVVWSDLPSGMRLGMQYWRHRIAVAAYGYRRLATVIGGPVGIDISPDVLATLRTYGPDVIAGALAMIAAAERREVGREGANGADGDESADAS